MNYNPYASYAGLRITHPYDGSLFPPDIAAPTLEWNDGIGDAGGWLVMVTFQDRQAPLYILCPEQRWTPEKELWDEMKRRSVRSPAQVTILGVRRTPLAEVVSKGVTRFSTSTDEVGAPIMFRRVPPDFAYAAEHPEQMQWVLADISSYEEPPVIMSKQPVCGSCHTFSRDGQVMGMDVDYKKDKGAYLLTRVRKDMVLTGQDFISWNAFPRTDGLQAQVCFQECRPMGRMLPAR
jgi:hypothetical protein